MATILGVILFVSILYSSIVPMFLVMKQADNLYEQKTNEIKRLDLEREKEDLAVYAYPIASEDEIEVNVISQCEVPVMVKRVWVNNTIYEYDNIVVESMAEKIIGQIPVNNAEGLNNSYQVRVTTARGNVFHSLAGAIEWDGSEWVSENLGIYVVIDSSNGGFLGFGQYRARVYNISVTDVEYNETKESNLQSGAATFLFEVTEPGVGTYKVEVYKRRGGWWSGYWWELFSEQEVEMEWPNGPSIIWVYT
jgi:hypothetical protein